MNFRTLGSRIEYIQAAKRLEEIANASPGTLQAQELKELILLFREFEKEIRRTERKPVYISTRKHHDWKALGFI